MSNLLHNNASIFYEETGTGEPIITIHGLSVNSAYWSKSGLTANLAKHYRVISMDMRGHGRTQVKDKPFGFDVDTIGDDIEALADALGIERFHLLGHSTGGMVAVRYAMRFDKRLISLMLTSTSSATTLISTDDELMRCQWYNKFADGFEKHTWEQTLAYLRQNPAPFFDTLAQHPNQKKMWQIVEDIFRLNDPKIIATFIRSFYTDPDPLIEKLRKISCSTLILIGEHDTFFIEPSQLMAKTIPSVKYVVLSDMGHMIAIENPAITSHEILTFLHNL
jgi:3-oxoadipate enol-lactonase